MINLTLNSERMFISVSRFVLISLELRLRDSNQKLCGSVGADATVDEGAHWSAFLPFCLV